MSDSKKTASAEEKPSAQKVTLWGHNQVVYTWPMLLGGIFLVILHLLEVPEAVGQWVFALTICLVLTTLGLDIKPGVIAVGSLLILLVGALVGVVYWLGDVNLLWYPWQVVQAFGPFGFVVLWLVGLWIYEYIHSWLWERYTFDRGRIEHMVFWGEDENWLGEGCDVKEPIDDGFEKMLWGSDLIIVHPEKTQVMHIRNVFRSSVAFNEILVHLPRDRSNQNT